ncbi:alpha/beta hydrolase [Bradyrhizobium sp. B117]|uniref:alpha/beta hydrolase n=1 Tax=Bradyrhizobium sp. B117 TaxID=3140246 RepID=UPI003183F328
MRRIWSEFLSFAFFISVGMPSGSCVAQPVIDAEVVLQTCQAFSKKSAENMPAIILPEAGKSFIEIYGRLSGLLEGCLSATETSRNSGGVTFLVQNTRYESVWYFSTDEGSIRRINIERYKPVTLADDELWQSPFAIAAASQAALGIAGLLAGTAETDSTAPITKGGPPKAIAPPSEPYTVEFFYATDRKESSDAIEFEGRTSAQASDGSTYSSNGWTAVSGYTGERSHDLSFGAIRVRVPEGHHIGKIELPSNRRIFGITLSRDGPDPKKHFTIRSIAKTSEDQWIKSLSSTKKKKALIFVHGFNTKFRDAVFRTAQIVWDLQFGGTAVLFSWPSRGEIADYLYDKDSALSSRVALLRVIDNLRKAKFETVDIIAHSMGNLIVVDALSTTAATKSPTVIAQLVMAAPDVDRDMFIQEIPRVAKVAKGLTLYASKNDKALQLSKRVAGRIPRAGDVPESGPIIIKSVSTIDVSAIGDELFGLNHNTFATTRNVLNDLKILLETGAPPPRLTEVRGVPEPPQTASYFRYAP